MTKYDGGTAFPMASGPEPRVDSATHFNEGMSLRVWFAGHATEEDVTHWLEIMQLNKKPVTREEAKYIYADAMIAERDKEETA